MYACWKITIAYQHIIWTPYIQHTAAEHKQHVCVKNIAQVTKILTSTEMQKCTRSAEKRRKSITNIIISSINVTSVLTRSEWTASEGGAIICGKDETTWRCCWQDAWTSVTGMRRRTRHRREPHHLHRDLHSHLHQQILPYYSYY